MARADDVLAGLIKSWESTQSAVKATSKTFDAQLEIFSNKNVERNKALRLFENDPNYENAANYRVLHERMQIELEILERCRENRTAAFAASDNAYKAVDAVRRLIKSSLDVKDVGLQPDMLIGKI